MPVNDSLAQDNYNRYAYARDNGHIDFLKRDREGNEFFEGCQWDEKVRNALERAGRPALTINQVFASLVNIMGEQLKNRVDATLRPGKDGSAETAQALAKIVMQILNDQNYDILESEAFDDGLLGSRGFLDLRVSFDDNLRGEAAIALLNPRNVLVDPDAEQYDPDTWKEVFITKWMLPDEIGATYGKKNGELLKQRTRSAFEMGFDSIDEYGGTFSGRDRNNVYGEKPDDRHRIRVIERQFREAEEVRHFVNPETGDTRLVPPAWDEYRVQFVAKQYSWQITQDTAQVVKARVSADNVILLDSRLSTKHFSPIPFFPLFRRGRTIGWVEPMIDPQTTLNKTISQELHVINSSANGGWQMEEGQLANMDADELERTGAQTGLVLERVAGTPPLEKIQPNQIPTGLDRKSFQMGEFLKEISGVSDTDRGFDREDVAARAIEAKKASGSTSKAKMFENLARTRKMLVRNLVDLVQEYYTEERVALIEGRIPGQEQEELVVNQQTAEGVVNDLTVGEYSVVVTQVPSRDTYFETQLDEASRMAEAGVPIPPSVFIANSNLANKDDVMEMINNSGEQERQQKLADLEIQEKELELAERQVEIQRKQAETELAASRAEKTGVDAAVAVSSQQQQGGEQDKARFEYRLAREKMVIETQLERERMEQEFALKRETMEREMVLKRAEASMRAKQQQTKPQGATA